MRWLPALLYLVISSTAAAQARLELALPYDGTSNNFLKLSYRSCEPSVYRILRAERANAIIDLHVGLTYKGGCNFWFSGTPTETAVYISLGQALGDDVALPSTITINLFDSDGQLFIFATFQSHAVIGQTTPIENGCYAPVFPAICIERHLNQIRANLAYYPYSDTAPVNQPAIPGIPLLAQGVS